MSWSTRLWGSGSSSPGLNRSGAATIRSDCSASGIQTRIAKPIAIFRQGDFQGTDFSPAGLPAPLLIRAAKIATIDAADATKLGKVSAASLRKVVAAIGQELGLRG